MRIEDLDPQRSRMEYARLIEDDLLWLGLEWDEGGLADDGPSGPYSQSKRSEIYRRYYERLVETGYVYPCRCTRADIMAANAPHQSDGRVIYPGTCRPGRFPLERPRIKNVAARLYAPDREIEYTDMIFGPRRYNLARDCGDFIVRRADGAWSYQLAVTVDDALMGVTEVTRGSDLLLSAAQQIYLRGLLKLPPVQYMHLPLVCNQQGQRLSKRDKSMSMESLRERFSREELLGLLARMANIIPSAESISLSELLKEYQPGCITPHPITAAI